MEEEEEEKEEEELLAPWRHHLWTLHSRRELPEVLPDMEALPEVVALPDMVAWGHRRLRVNIERPIEGQWTAKSDTDASITKETCRIKRLVVKMKCLSLKKRLV